MTFKRIRQKTPEPGRQSLYKRAILVAMLGNAALAAAKAVLAWTSGSSAVFSDAANSISDTLYSALMSAGLYLSQQPADEGHPQGHTRFEPLVSLLIAGAMASAGVTAAYHGMARFLGETRTIDPWWPTVVLLTSAGVKVGMFVVVRRIGRQAHSPAISASARDNLADVLTSLAALTGVWGSRLVSPLLDPLAGVLVAFWIFRAAWEIAKENFGYLTGRGASEELSRHIAEVALQIEGIDGVHQIVADYVGPQLRVDMHIDIDGDVSLYEAHELSNRVRRKIEALPEVDLAFVHVEPTPRPEISVDAASGPSDESP